MARAFKVRRVVVDGRRQPRYVARLDAGERDLVAGLLGQVAELIEVPDSPDPTFSAADPGSDFDAIVAGLGMGSLGESAQLEGQVGTRAERPGHVSDIEDPAIRRLFPIANRSDAQAAAEFARFSEIGLRRRKRDIVQRAAALLNRGGSAVELTAEEANTLLVALTDVRVVLGERMGLRTDEDAAALDRLVDDLDVDDVRVQLTLVYDFLTWLQESLALALLRSVPAEGTARDEP